MHKFLVVRDSPLEVHCKSAEFHWKYTGSQLEVHWESTGCPLGVHWESTGSPRIQKCKSKALAVLRGDRVFRTSY